MVSNAFKVLHDFVLPQYQTQHVSLNSVKYWHLECNAMVVLLHGTAFKPDADLHGDGCGSKTGIPTWVALASGHMVAKTCGLPLLNFEPHPDQTTCAAGLPLCPPVPSFSGSGVFREATYLHAVSGARRRKKNARRLPFGGGGGKDTPASSPKVRKNTRICFESRMAEHPSNDPHLV